ncbi:MAG: divergent polysaccharide deacetylase family protein [Acetobacteraceae bacterium]|nr:divergent polysaccharide deacetylase family protein [Acetobacteraceae bacterium]
MLQPAGLPAWRAYARPFDDSDPRPRVALLVVGLGMSEAATRFAIEQLPGPISLAFSPYGLNLESQMAAARAAGHEVLLGIPMEPANFPLNDPGPRALMTGNPPPENIARLHWILRRGVGYVGVTNAASAVLRGERFMASTEAMRPIYEVLRERGLIFIEARPSERAPTALPSRSANLVVDERMSRTEIDARLGDLERLSRERGVALGIAGPSQLTLERVASWAQVVELRGIALAPVSAIVVRSTAQARP